MKFLLLVLFAGLGLAAASDFRQNLDNFDVVQYYEDEDGEHMKGFVSYDDVNPEAESLRKRLDELSEKASTYTNAGREVPRDILIETQRVFKLMEQKNIELTIHEELLKYVVDHVLKNGVHALLYALENEDEDDFAKRLRERLEELLEKIKDAIENRKILGGNVVTKFREIYNEMKEKSIPFGDKIQEIFEEVKDKATGIWKRILEKINISSDVAARGTGAENLRERFQELLEKVRDAFRERKLPGKRLLAKLREVREEMRRKNIPLGGSLREFIEKLKENSNSVWRRILDRLQRRAPEPSDALEILHEDPKTELEQILTKHLDEILDKIQDIVDSGKTFQEDLVEKAKEIVQQLKDMGSDISDHAKKVLKDIKKKAKDYWRKVLDKLSFDSENNHKVYADEPETELSKVLKKNLDEILDNLKDIVEDGRVYEEDLVEKAKEIAQKLKDMNVDVGDYARKVISDLKEKAKDYWKKVLEKIGLNY